MGTKWISLNSGRQSVEITLVKFKTDVSNNINCNTQYLAYIHMLFQEESAILRENVLYVNLPRHNQTYLYPKLKGYRDNDARKMWSFRGTIYCTYFVRCVVHRLRRSVLEAIAKPNRTEASVQCIVLENPRMISIKLVRFCFAQSMYLCHSNVNQMLSTGVKITETTNSSSSKYVFCNQ